MASNREIIEVLHLVGATDRYIAREFEKHFLRLGVRAGLVGAVCAMGVFLSMTAVMELVGGGGVTVAEVHRLIGTGGLDIEGYVLLGGVVVIIAVLCTLTSRLACSASSTPSRKGFCPLPQRERRLCTPVHRRVTSATKSASLIACTVRGTEAGPG